MNMQYEIDAIELATVRGSMKNGRAHDVTMFIFDRFTPGSDIWDTPLAAIRKPGFPTGAYRAPSGGVEPGEAVEAAARREAYEETGLDIELERYLLRIRARFTHGPEVVNWVTHIFSARVVGGELEPKDTVEIEDAGFVTLKELQGPIRDILLSSGRALFAYRVALTDATVAILRPSTDTEGLRPSTEGLRQQYNASFHEGPRQNEGMDHGN
ncbi:MAG: NUDIX hydrolase [Chloroflexi bacterium]|nr:NUDIX hydrolase [Chloroflexota bacterium]